MASVESHYISLHHYITMTSYSVSISTPTGCRMATHEVVPLDGALALGGVQPQGLLLAVVERRLRPQEPWLERLLCHLIS